MPAPLHIFADGSFNAVSRSGGWAFVVFDEDRQIDAVRGSEAGLTNNSFEVMAAVKAMLWIDLEAPGRIATLWTDSAHVVEGCHRWRTIWRGNGWKRINPNPHARRRPVADMALWQKLDMLLRRNPQVSVAWCKGHSGIAANDLADALARAG